MDICRITPLSEYPIFYNTVYIANDHEEGREFLWLTLFTTFLIDVTAFLIVILYESALIHPVQLYYWKITSGILT